MSVRIAVVHEADPDLETATELADRALIESVDWLDTDILTNQRVWLSKAVHGERLTWKGIIRLAREAGIRAYGHFQGQPGQPDAAAARRAILFILMTFPDLDAIVLIRDQDDEPERKVGLEQARNGDRSGVTIVIGLAIVERECWVLNGFEPKDSAELSRLEVERNSVGFDPRLRSHDLTACKDGNATRSPKRVLRMLAMGDRERERCCWMESSLEVLRERGNENGLAAYLLEVRDRLGPLIGHVPRH